MKLYLPAILSFHLALSNVATASLRGLAGGSNEQEDTNHQIVGGEPAANGAYPFFANPIGGGCGASVSSNREKSALFSQKLNLQIVSISFCSWSTRMFLSVRPIVPVS